MQIDKRTQPWFIEPNEVYASEPFETLDGGQVLWHANLGAAGLDLQGAYGTTSQALQSGTSVLPITAKSAY